MGGTSQVILAVKTAAVPMTAARLLCDKRRKALPYLSSVPVLYGPDGSALHEHLLRSEMSQWVLVPGVYGAVEGQGQA